MFESALTFSLTVVGATDVYDHLFWSTQHSISLFTLIWYLITGIACGFAGWSNMEGKYENALIEARLNAASQSK